MVRRIEIIIPHQKELINEPLPTLDPQGDVFILAKNDSGSLEMAKPGVPVKTPKRRETPEIGDPMEPRRVPKPIVIPAPEPEKKPIKTPREPVHTER